MWWEAEKILFAAPIHCVGFIMLDDWEGKVSKFNAAGYLTLLLSI